MFICEASYINEYDLAREYKHMTVEQVAKIAKKSKVGKLVLFHISQRHEANEKDYVNTVKKIFKNLDLASDLMEIQV